MLKKYDDFVSLEGASENDIKSAEIELRVIFSEDYKQYLSKYGAASSNGHEFTGISASKRLNVVDVTKRIRDRGYNIPKDFYVVEELDIDDIVVCQNQKGEVYQFDKNSSKRIFKSLAEYLAI